MIHGKRESFREAVLVVSRHWGSTFTPRKDVTAAVSGDIGGWRYAKNKKLKRENTSIFCRSEPNEPLNTRKNDKAGSLTVGT